MTAFDDLDLVLAMVQNQGFFASASSDLGPTVFTVESRDGAGYLSFAVDFNVSGWEVAYDEDDADQEPLHAWLSGDAPAEQLACWAAALALAPRNALDRNSSRPPLA